MTHKTYKKTIAFLIIAILLFAGAYFVLGGFGRSGPEAAPNLDEYGLVGYWNMEEGKGQTVYDRSGNGNNGTLGGTTAVQKSDPVFTSGYSSSGPGGTALKFDGKDDYIDAGNGASLNITNAITIEAWMKIPTSGAASELVIISKGYSTAGYTLSIASVRLYTGGIGLQFNQSNITTSNYDGNWHYYSATYDGTTINYYKDGLNIGSVIDTDGMATYANALRIGYYWGGAPPYYANGSIDEVRIYNRALSADEIRQHYNQKKPIIDLKMDEGSGTTAKDQSFNNNDITLVNTPSWLQGKFGSALDLESSSSQYGYLADNANISLTGDLTISAWIKPESVTAATLFDIAGKWDGANGSYLLSQYGDEIRMYIDAAANYKTTDSANLVAGNWYHIESTYNATSQTVNIYINGVLQKGTVSGTIPASIGDDTQRFHIGAEDSSTTAANFYDGAIDEVKVYSYSRTQDEILVDYNDGKAAHLGKDSQRDDGLVGYWNMEEGRGQTVYDRSGNGNNGTLGVSTAVAKNDPVFTSGYSSSGPGGTALKFDGKDDYVNAGSGSSLDITSDITISTWINPATVTPQYQQIIGRGISNTNRYDLYLTYDEIKFAVNITTGYRTTTAANIPTSSWSHIVATFNNATDTVKFYINGQLNLTFTDFTDVPVTNNGNFFIGRFWNSSNYPFSGSIDEVRIYNRALSADEIRQRYNQKKPIIDLKMDEGSGTTTKDQSFNNNDITLVNTPFWLQGKFGSALDMESSSSQYGYLADNANISLAGDLTISAWIKPESTTAATLFDIAGKWDGANESYLLSQYGDEVRLYINAAANYKTTDSANLVAGNWYHIESTYNAASQTVNIYINGVFQAGTVSGTIPASIDNDAGRFHIGAEDSTTAAANFYDGVIDEAKVYSYLRTQDEILVDYNDGKAAHLGKDNQRDDGLVGYWNMEEGKGQLVYDRSGNGNNGTLGASTAVAKDDPVFTSGYTSSGPGGTALKFDGKDDYVNVGNSTSLQIGTPFSIEGWVYISSSGNGNWIYGKETARHMALIVESTNKPAMYWGDGVSAINGLTSATVLNNNQWYHLAGTFQYNGVDYTATLYINGSEDKKATSSNSNIAYSSVSYIGHYYGTKYFSGSIDEVRIYNRALSADEIRQHYNQKKPVLDLKFDEGSGTSTKDESFNNNDGTITGATWTTGKYGSALDFDGIDDVVAVTQASSINLTSKTGYTISTWVYPHSDGEGDAGKIIYKGANNYLRVDTEGSGLLDVEAKLDLATTDATLNIVDAVPINTWSHIVLTYEDDSDDEVTIYINGINKGTSADGGGAPAIDSNNLLIGGDTAANFDGLIDSVRIYNYARTPAEILVDYNNGVAAHLK